MNWTKTAGRDTLFESALLRAVEDFEFPQPSTTGQARDSSDSDGAPSEDQLAAWQKVRPTRKVDQLSQRELDPKSNLDGTTLLRNTRRCLEPFFFKW